ncbi:MAG: hypothetical protein HC912_00340 [Saprospiraceae bacterium]|nr:hypothetical protein [Saprospiraceae bacterium]
MVAIRTGLFPSLGYGRSKTFRRNRLDHSAKNYRLKKLAFSNQLGAQFATRERKGETIIEHSIASRLGLDWEFKKEHRLYSRITINGGFDEKIWEWDRLRWDSGLKYTFNDNHTFDFSYRFQQRLTGKKRTAEGVVFRYSIDF